MENRIILASASPRRKEILEKLNINFEVLPSGCEEKTTETEPGEIVRELAAIKAEDVFLKVSAETARSDEWDSGADSRQRLVVIGADTIVDHRGIIMGKPHSPEEAKAMIRSYAGDTHLVHTGVCILVANDDGNVNKYNFTVTSSVNVVEMSEEEIEAYVMTGEPMDKAGAYALQGLFAPYISGIRGDYYNIVGLPICEVYHILKKECIL